MTHEEETGLLATVGDLNRRLERVEAKNRELEEKLNSAIKVAAGVNLTIGEKIESIWQTINAIKPRGRRDE